MRARRKKREEYLRKQWSSLHSRSDEQGGSEELAQGKAGRSQVRRRQHTFRMFVRRLLRRSEGAVTVFFIVVIAMILLLSTVLIDYARIASFHTLTEHAVRTAARSVLSAYDAALYERYGLFARGGTPGETIFEKSLRGTLEYDGGDLGYRPMIPSVDRYTVETAAYLGRYDVLGRQILEEMKIKAPVDFMIDMGSRFTSMSKLMKETSTTSEALAQTGKLYDKRQKAALTALDRMRDLAQLASGSMTGDEAASLASNFASYEGWEQSADSLSSSIANAEVRLAAGSNLTTKEKQALKDEISSMEQQRQSLRYQISAYLNNMWTLADNIHMSTSDALSELPRLAQSVIDQIAQAEAHNRDIRTAVAQAESSVAAGYDRVSDQSEAADSETSDHAETVHQLRKSSEQLVWEDRWFTSFRKEIEQQAEDLKAVAAAADTFAASAEVASAGSGGDASALSAEAARIQQAYNIFAQRYLSPAAIITQREQLIRAADAADRQRKREEAEAKSIMNDTKRMMSSGTTDDMTTDETERYKQVAARYDANRLFNTAADEAVEAAAQWEDDVEGQRESSVSMMGALFNGLADMLAGTRDTLYTGEYVFHRFQSYQSQLKMTAGGNNVSETIGHATAFGNQEAEYILYGFDKPGANVAAAMAEIFGLRFAIRLTEGFIECRSLGHPLLVLSGALLYAARNAAMDMKDLMEKGSTKLTKFAAVDIRYSDYLRLFMLLHGGGDKRLSRIAAVIETNTGTDLSLTPAAVSASADVSMKLLFLPGAMKVLGRFGLLQGKVVGNRYETTKLVGAAY
ncbi:hypothetical protein H8B09_00705 [Paenibacillus sp. PR3]|uniref:Uncharacterized protein n=1 Tax=Paenibacillus terricola TaxID=2763503 RepID=A0ABR8MQT3_9BACL|nr:hypothetical protein [Paenibacillus terricola]MBD3917257.1 hypothetical protein [Paenibacillus terricola]